MESPSRFELTKAEMQSEEETELGEVKVTLPTSTVATSTPVQPGTIPCRNGGCKSWTSRAESRMESPWHFLKTIFLISVIVALILWIIVYTFLAQYRILWRVWGCKNHGELVERLGWFRALPYGSDLSLKRTRDKPTRKKRFLPKHERR